jgi:hypothetical protein
MVKSVLKPEGRQMTSQYGARALFAVYGRLHAPTRTYTHTQTICNTYYFYMATIVSRTPLNSTLYVHVACIVITKKKVFTARYCLNLSI